MENIFSPLTINSMVLKNRIMMAPMGLHFTNDGFVNDRIIKFYEKRAEGGVGLIDVGACTIHELAGNNNFIRIDHDKYIPQLTKLVSEVKKHGAKIIAQLYHPGSSAYSWILEGKQSISSSVVRNDFSGEVPRALLLEEIPGVQQQFVDAALRTQKAGFDGIDVIGAAGYLISQFLSPVRNKREDAYGGPLENRMRFGLEIVQKLRAQLGKDYPLFFKLAANEFVKGGHGLPEARIFARELEAAGIDCLITGGGWHETKVPQLTMNVPEGTWTYLAKEMKKVISIPVVTCNQIRNPSVAEEILRNGLADIVAMGRQLIADPEYVTKVKEGRSGDINFCVGCLQGCFDKGTRQEAVGCLVNPGAGKEYETRKVPAAAAKRVMVIGGGAAGMAAALALSDRGHKVTIYEKTGVLGGQLPLVSVPRDRRPFQLFQDYLTSQVNKRGITTRLNCEVTPAKIIADTPDAVVVATGAKPVAPNIPGIQRPHVFQAWDVLRERVSTGKNIVILGGGATGCETASFLAMKGTISPEALQHLFLNDAEDAITLKELSTKGVKNVTIVEMLPKIGNGIGQSTKWAIIQNLKKIGVQLLPNTKAISIEEDYVLVQKEGKEEKVYCDSIVLALGAKSDNSISSKIDKSIKEVHTIGDAARVGTILDAVHQGFEIAGKVGSKNG